MPTTKRATGWPWTDGEMADRIRTHDWAATPLGPIESWLQSLRTAVEIMLAVPKPATIMWSPAHVQFYNDAYIAIARDRHPGLLGLPVEQGWPEAFEDVTAPLLRTIAAGQAVVKPELVVPLCGPDGRVEERVFDVTSSPLRDETGAVAGALQKLTEVTDRYKAQARLRESEERQRFLLKLSDILQRLHAPNEIKAAAMRMLGTQLGVARAQYHEIDSSGECYDTDGVGFANGLPLLTGKHRMDQFGSFVAEALTAGRPFHTDDFSTDLRPTVEEREAFAKYGVRAGAAVPLLRGGKLVAVLAVHDVCPHRWTGLEIDLIRETAERVWVAVEKVRTEAAVRASEERQRFLLALGDAVRARSAAADKIETAARHLGERLGASRVLWAEYDWDKNVAYIFNGWFADGAQPFPTVMRLEDYDGKVLNDLKAGRTVRVEDVALRSDEPAYAAIAAVGVQALLSVPLVVDGILKVNLSIHQHDARHWTDDEVALVQEVAERLWAEVVRARAEAALTESQERQAFLLRFADTLRAEPDADAVLARAVRMLAEELNLDRCYATVMNPAEDRAEVAGEYRRPGLPPMPSPLRFSDFPETGKQSLSQTLIYDDTATHPGLSDKDRASLGALEFRALLSSIVRRGSGNPIWSLGAVSSTPRSWSASEVALVEEAAERTWAVVERARGEAALRESEEHQSFLLRLSDALGSLTDPVAIQGEAARLLGEQVKADRTYYSEMNEAEGVAVVAIDYVRGDAPSVVGRHPYDFYAPIVEDARSGRTVAEPDVAADLRLSEADREAIKALGIGSYLSVPLLKAGRLVAILTVSDVQPRHWTNAEITFVRETAERTWDAVERARVEAALRKSEERFRQFGDASADVLWIVDAATRRLEYARSPGTTLAASAIWRKAKACSPPPCWTTWSRPSSTHSPAASGGWSSTRAPWTESPTSYPKR